MRVRVAVFGTVGKTVVIDTNPGAQIGVSLRGPDGNVLSVQQLRDLLAGGGASTLFHSALQGLQQGNDHPQYPLKLGKEAIKGQWDFYNYTNINRTSLTRWAYVTFNDMSGSGGPPVRLAHDDLGSFHIAANAIYAGTGNNFNQSDVSKPSFMFSLNQQFDAFVWHAIGPGGGPVSWNNASALMRLTQGGLLQVLADGSASTPAVAISGTTTGMWQSSGKIRFSISGAETFNANNTEFDAGGRFRTQGFSAGLPSYSFFVAGGTTSGMFLAGANDLGFSTDATLRFDISTTAVTSTLQMLGPAGSAGAPTWSWSGDPSSGLYSAGADNPGISVGGTPVADWTTTAYRLLLDSYQLQIGAGQDLKLYHDGTDSFIANTAGKLFVDSSGGRIDVLPSTAGATANVNIGLESVTGANATLPGLKISQALRVIRYGSAVGSVLSLGSINGTVAAPTPTVSGDILGQLVFTGARNTTPTVAGQAFVRGVATENWSGTVNGTKLSFLATSDGSNTFTERLSIQDQVRALVPIRLFGYTVATLPAAAAGDTAYVTDALLPAFGVAVVGGGAVVIPVFYDGVNWIVG